MFLGSVQTASSSSWPLNLYTVISYLLEWEKKLVVCRKELKYEDLNLGSPELHFLYSSGSEVPHSLGLP